MSVESKAYYAIPKDDRPSLEAFQKVADLIDVFSREEFPPPDGESRHHTQRGLEKISPNEILFLAEVRLWSMDHPGKLLVIKEIAQGIESTDKRRRGKSITKEAGRRLYDRLKDEHDLPPKQDRLHHPLPRDSRELLLREQLRLFRDIQAERRAVEIEMIKKGRLEGKRDALISQETGIPLSKIRYLPKTYLLTRDPSLSQRSRRRSNKEIEDYDKQVRHCIDVLGLSDNETAERLKTSLFLVRKSKSRQYRSGQMQKPRTKSGRR